MMHPIFLSVQLLTIDNHAENYQHDYCHNV